MSYFPGSSSEEHTGDSASSDAFPCRQGCCIYHLTLCLIAQCLNHTKVQQVSVELNHQIQEDSSNYQSSCSLAKRAEVLQYLLFKIYCQKQTRKKTAISSVQFSRSVVSNSLRPHELQHSGLPVHHKLLEFTQTHAHRVGDAIQPSHPLSSPSPPAPNPSQHQGLFQ